MFRCRLQWSRDTVARRRHLGGQRPGRVLDLLPDQEESRGRLPGAQHLEDRRRSLRVRPVVERQGHRALVPEPARLHPADGRERPAPAAASARQRVYPPAAPGREDADAGGAVIMPRCA